MGPRALVAFMLLFSQQKRETGSTELHIVNPEQSAIVGPGSPSVHGVQRQCLMKANEFTNKVSESTTWMAILFRCGSSDSLWRCMNILFSLDNWKGGYTMLTLQPSFTSHRCMNLPFSFFFPYDASFCKFRYRLGLARCWTKNVAAARARFIFILVSTTISLTPETAKDLFPQSWGYWMRELLSTFSFSNM